MLPLWSKTFPSCPHIGLAYRNDGGHRFRRLYVCGQSVAVSFALLLYRTGGLKSVQDRTQINRGTGILFRHALPQLCGLCRPVNAFCSASFGPHTRQRQLRRDATL